MEQYSLYNNTTGSYNTAVGWSALAGITTSWHNTAIDVDSGGALDNGDDNTFVGSRARTTLSGVCNGAALGNAAYINASNQVRIGNSLVLLAVDIF